MNNAIRAGIRSYLQIQEANPRGITIRELLDYEGNAIKNRIWYRGDSYELSQLYEQISSGADSMKFWAAKASPGQEIRKIHTGVPALIVDTLASLSIADMDIAIEGDQTAEELFEEMSDDNDLTKEILTAVKESLYIGDGAFKITFDKGIPVHRGRRFQDHVRHGHLGVPDRRILSRRPHRAGYPQEAHPGSDLQDRI